MKAVSATRTAIRMRLAMGASLNLAFGTRLPFERIERIRAFTLRATYDAAPAARGQRLGARSLRAGAVRLVLRWAFPARVLGVAVAMVLSAVA